MRGSKGASTTRRLGTSTGPTNTEYRSGPPRKASRLRSVLPSLPTAHENIYTIPNILTFSRLIAAPFVGYTILHDHHAWALGLFAYAGITDLLDGWIARKWKQQTVVGTVIDPMADKTLVTILVVALATKGALPGKSHLVPTPLNVLQLPGYPLIFTNQQLHRRKYGSPLSSLAVM